MNASASMPMHLINVYGDEKDFNCLIFIVYCLILFLDIDTCFYFDICVLTSLYWKLVKLLLSA